jgi:stage II sporulation protein D
MQNSRWSAWRKLTAGIATAAVLGGVMQTLETPTAAAVSGSTPIRVGLLISSGSVSKTTDTVTLSGRGGLRVGFYINGAFTGRYDAASAAKSSLDNYYVVAGEYGSLGEAQNAADSLDSLGFNYDIEVEVRGGAKVYQVINGYYESRGQADSALSRVRSSFSGAVLKGYNRLTTGKVSGQAGAEAKANELRGMGFDAYPLARRDGSYEVWIGNEASAGELDALKARVQAKTGAAYSKGDYNPADYLLIKKTIYGSQEVPHVLLNSAVEEIAFQAKGSPAVIKVMEKANVEYRGSILIQGYNERPNVINYVPLDQYLYGVVPKEMSSGWPLEALKAQAVAARTYAARQIGSKKWGIADITDNTWDQAYLGYTIEGDDATAAVDSTKGQVLTKNGAMIEAVYSSNNGGYTADAREMWGSSVDYLQAVDSKFDYLTAENEPLYYRVQLSNGKVGWMRADNVKKSGKNGAGLETGTVISSATPVRIIPNLYAKVMQNPTAGERVLILDQEREYNTYNWQRGPYSPTEMQNMINGNQFNGYPGVDGPVYDLRVTKWGQGQHIMEIAANGKAVTMPAPDNYRALFDDLSSTRMTIEQLGTYTVLGANGAKTEYPNAKLQGKTLNVISASGTVSTQINGGNEEFVVLDGSGKNRVVKQNQSYILHGYGWGHSLGMSQWGANGMAKNGYTYDQILTHYYVGVTLTPKQ